MGHFVGQFHVPPAPNGTSDAMPRMHTLFSYLILMCVIYPVVTSIVSIYAGVWIGSSPLTHR